MMPVARGLLCLTVILQFYVATAKEVTCGFPGTPAYGYVKPDLEAYEESDVVSYSCRVGYILLGSPISRCTKNGSWTESVPICDDSMTTLGVAFSTPTVPGHSAEMAIDRDKETCSYLKPKKPRWWRIDLGSIHKVLSVAVTMISSDKNVKFTIFVIKTLEGSASYKRCASFSGKFGTQTVVLSCDEGKGIVGEKVHIEDHLQTEGLFEICEVEVQVEKDTGYDCGRPSRNLYSITYAPRGSRVDYGCIRGYEIKGKDYRTCLFTGQWSGEPPVCEPIICDDLEPLENGKVKFVDLMDGIHLEGTIVSYKCDEGFKLLGSFTRACLKDGSWSGKAPQCKAIRCPVPDGKDVGGVYRLVNKTNSMGSMALLRCKRGQREGDNPYIVCMESGTWTEPEAHCILPAGAVDERKDEPAIANLGAIIFGMIVASAMIVVVLVALYLKSKIRRNGAKPELPSRFIDPPAPPPRPPPRGDFKSTIMGLISRDSEKAEDQRELQNSWRDNDRQSSRDDKDDPAVIQVEVLAQGDSKRKGVYPVPEENEDAALENIILDMDEKSDKGTSLKDQKSDSDYAAVDYEKKRQSRLLKEQDSIDSSSTAAASPLPPDDSDKIIARSPTPPKQLNPSETEEESGVINEAENEKRKKEEEKKAKEDEKKAKEEEKKAKEEEKKAKEMERKKAKDEKKAKEAEEKKAKEAEKKKAKEEEKKAKEKGERKVKEEEDRKAKEEEARKAKEEEERRSKEEEERRTKEEEERKAKEEEERKAKEEEERKAKDEEERKAKDEEASKVKEEEERNAKEEVEKKAKEEAEEKEKATAPPPSQRRRRVREEPPPPEEDKPVLRRLRRFQ